VVATGGGWLALLLTASLNWLFAALAFGLIVNGVSTYGGDHIRGVVWSERSINTRG
jgi:hypothetical protein